MAKTTIDKIPGGKAGVSLGENPSGGTTPNGENSAIPPINQNGNINWLNGSYAGADIKVVAHLYTDIDRTESLEEQLTFVTQIITGAQALKATPFSSQILVTKDSVLRESFHNRIGPVDPKVIGTLYQLLYPVYVAYVTRPYAFRRDNLNYDLPAAAEAVIQDYTAQKESIATRLADQQEKDLNSSNTLVLEQLQTISLQSFREKNAVRSLGKSYVSGYTRGPRTLGGSMIFTMIREHPLSRLLQAVTNIGLYGGTKYDLPSSLIPDQLPPIDLTLVFANEYGSISRMGIYGVEFSTDGITLSSEDIMTECVCQFVARDVDIVTSIGMKRLSRYDKLIYDNDGQVMSGSDLYFSSREAYDNYIRKIGLRHMFKGR